MTAVAIGLARSPMTIATQANDLQLRSEGRFHLGLGSQITPHIERRLPMPSLAPAARMPQLGPAVRAIWSAWPHQTRLRFECQHLTPLYMTPSFHPPPKRQRP